MTARARLLAVVGIVLAGAIGIISSTQTWLSVALDDGAHDVLTVAGADAVPVLAPLSLATLALGLAIAIVGRVLRYVFGALSLAIAAMLLVATSQVVFAPTAQHVASTVTEATGITGSTSVASLVSSITPTAWPAIALVAWVLLAAAGVFALATAHTWRGSGRRYRTEAASPANTSSSRPHDAIDDWDDLSRGDDPTATPR